MIRTRWKTMQKQKTTTDKHANTKDQKEQTIEKDKKIIGQPRKTHKPTIGKQ